MLPRLDPPQPIRPSGQPPNLDRDRRQRLEQVVRTIAVPRNRLTAQEGIRHVQAFLKAQLEALGLVVEEQPFEPQWEIATRLPDRATEGVLGVNLIATQPGQPRYGWVLGAHYDSVCGSPGADDNGSALAVLLEVARLLTPGRVPVTYVCFDMEEWGLLGARAFVAGGPRIEEAIILESVGYTGEQHVPGELSVLFPQQLKWIEDRDNRGDFTVGLYRNRSTERAARVAGFLEWAGEPVLLMRDPLDIPLVRPLLKNLVPAIGNFARSDHQAFWDAGLPAVMLTDTANFRNPHYHTPQDTPEKLDYLRMERIALGLAHFLAAAAGAG